MAADHFEQTLNLAQIVAAAAASCEGPCEFIKNLEHVAVNIDVAFAVALTKPNARR